MSVTPYYDALRGTLIRTPEKGEGDTILALMRENTCRQREEYKNTIDRTHEKPLLYMLCISGQSPIIAVHCPVYLGTVAMFAHHPSDSRFNYNPRANSELKILQVWYRLGVVSSLAPSMRGFCPQNIIRVAR